MHAKDEPLTRLVALLKSDLFKGSKLTWDLLTYLEKFDEQTLSVTIPTADIATQSISISTTINTLQELASNALCRALATKGKLIGFNGKTITKNDLPSLPEALEPSTLKHNVTLLEKGNIAYQRRLGIFREMQISNANNISPSQQNNNNNASPSQQNDAIYNYQIKAKNF